MNFSERIFRPHTVESFNALALELFHRTLEFNPVYRDYTRALGIRPETITAVSSIPFLPIGFFKTHKVYASAAEPQKIFLSSGTTGMERSHHYLADTGLYLSSLLEGFRYFYGDPAGYSIGALTPTPEENPRSSLIFMIDELMRRSGERHYLKPSDAVSQLRRPGRKTMIIGLTYALLDMAEQGVDPDPALIIVETGGMKGRRKEMIREELHHQLKKSFGVPVIHSEYSMSELLSQAWSQGDGIYRCPPWMKVIARDPSDPLSLIGEGRTGGLNIIDLANVYTCPFIATQDLGKVSNDGSFRVLGRFDDSELRGCNLMEL